MDNPETLTTLGTQETGWTMIDITLHRKKLQSRWLFKWYERENNPCSTIRTRRVTIKQHEHHLLRES